MRKLGGGEQPEVTPFENFVVANVLGSSISELVLEASFAAKVKIIVGFYQVVQAFPADMAACLGADASRFLSSDGLLCPFFSIRRLWHLHSRS